MNNYVINNYQYGYNINPTGAIRHKQILPESIKTAPKVQICDNSQNFEDDYWKYQNTCALNNRISINQNSNYNTGKFVMNEFYKKYPNLNSFTMTETIVKKLENNNANPYVIQKMKEQADINFKTMIEILDKRPDFKDITFEQYINMIENEFQQYNHANCGERAYYLHNLMNQKGIDNTIIEISGNSASNSHVFNVIGLDKNADINNPETWGENAIVVDVWAKKLTSAKSAIEYYKDFLGYDENNPMQFKKLDTNEIFKHSS